MSAKVDGVLEELGALGKYQIYQQFVAGSVSVVAALHFIVLVFHSITPDHRCRIPGFEDKDYLDINHSYNTSVLDWIPLNSNQKLEHCIRFTEAGLNSSETSCTEYVYNTTMYHGTSLTMHFNLVCSKAGVSTAVKVVFTAGLVVGAMLVGVLGDRYGRRKTMIGCMLVGGVCGIAAGFSVNIYMYAVFRFVIAMCYVGVAVVGHCVTMEITGPSRRPYILVLKCLFWPTGTCLSSLIAYYIPDWNWLQLAFSIPSLLSGILLILFLNETPHFLVTKSRHKEAADLFQQIAQWNGVCVPKDMIEKLKEHEEAAKTEKIISIFKSPTLLKRLLVFLFLWFTAGLSYWGLNYNVGNLTGSIYVNNVISGAVEMPVAICMVLTKIAGRKILTIACLVVGGVSLFACSLMYVFIDVNEHSIALVTVAMIGKFGISVVFTFDYVWSSEVFPSTLRSSLVGLCSLFARIGVILAPIITDMYMYVDTPFGSGLGAFIFGITMLIAGALTFYLPETNNLKVPETIADAEKFAIRPAKHSKTDEEELESVKSDTNDKFIQNSAL